MIHPLADCKNKNIPESTRVWQFCVVFENCKIGENCNICSHCFIENDVSIGNNVTIKSGVYLWDGVTLEDNVQIGANVTFVNDVPVAVNDERGTSLNTPVVVDVLYPEELPQLIGQTKLEAELIKNLSFEGVG